MPDFRQILPFFILPLGLTMILVLVGLLRRRRLLVALGLAVLWLSSTPVVSNFVARAVEGFSERALATDAPTADAIVVLSSGRLIAPGKAEVSEWRDADRFFGGIELFRAGKAPLLVFTGGWMPSRADAELEGKVLARYATSMGLGADSIFTTGRVANTEEESRAVARLLRERRSARGDSATGTRILLVTSAFHMSRAQMLFERAGLTVFPFPVDFKVSAGTSFGVMSLLPSPWELSQTSTSIRELYGRILYSIFPRIGPIY